MMGFTGYISSLFGRKAYQIRQIGLYADESTLKEAKKLIINDNATLSYGRFSVSKEMLEDFPFPVLHPISQNRDIQGRIIEINKKVEDAAREKAYYRFSKNAMSKITGLLSPSHSELNDLRTLLALQLLSSERVHIYLLSDPSVLSSEILRFAAALYEPSVFVSAAGSKIILSDVRKTHGWSKGVLGLHTEGLVCVDEIDQLREPDSSALALCMNQGLFYEENDKRKQKQTKVMILASSNAQSGRFVGKSIDILRRQVPVSNDLLLAFHFVVLLRDNGTQKVSQFKIHKPDYDFVKGYCSYASSFNVEVSAEAEEKIYSESEKLKLLDSNFIRPFDNQIVVGMIRLAKANAKMRLRKEVTAADVEAVSLLLERLLVVKREDVKGR
jgi:DNA replicative helicase MCM subunit Mcm2 (Cdc46/Mcm family)